MNRTPVCLAVVDRQSQWQANEGNDIFLIRFHGYMRSQTWNLLRTFDSTRDSVNTEATEFLGYTISIRTQRS